MARKWLPILRSDEIEVGSGFDLEGEAFSDGVKSLGGGRYRLYVYGGRGNRVQSYDSKSPHWSERFEGYEDATDLLLALYLDVGDQENVNSLLDNEYDWLDTRIGQRFRDLHSYIPEEETREHALERRQASKESFEGVTLEGLRKACEQLDEDSLLIGDIFEGRELVCYGEPVTETMADWLEDLVEEYRQAEGVISEDGELDPDADTSEVDDAFLAAIGVGVESVHIERQFDSSIFCKGTIADGDRDKVIRRAKRIIAREAARLAKRQERQRRLDEALAKKLQDPAYVKGEIRKAMNADTSLEHLQHVRLIALNGNAAQDAQHLEKRLQDSEKSVKALEKQKAADRQQISETQLRLEQAQYTADLWRWAAGVLTEKMSGSFGPFFFDAADVTVFAMTQANFDLPAAYAAREVLAKVSKVPEFRIVKFCPWARGVWHHRSFRKLPEKESDCRGIFRADGKYPEVECQTPDLTQKFGDRIRNLLGSLVR